MSTARRLEPRGERENVGGHRPKGLHCLGGLSAWPKGEQTSHDRLLVDVQSCAARVEYLHRVSCGSRWWWNDPTGHPAPMNLLRVLSRGRQQTVMLSTIKQL